MTLKAGERLGVYEIVAPLGAGAMGEVWRARDTRLEREVAVKVLPEHFADDEERLRRFEREAREQDARAHTGALGLTDGPGSFAVVRGDRLEASCTAA